MFHLVWAKHALQDLAQLSVPLKRRIMNKVHFFSRQTDLKPFAKALQGEKGVFRFRVGEYRALFRIESSGEIRILKVLRVKHRKDIYHEL